jgi:hypothetical protein
MSTISNECNHGVCYKCNDEDCECECHKCPECGEIVCICDDLDMILQSDDEMLYG